MQWAHMPTGWLNAYAHMYGRLRADEQLRAISAAAAGTGAMEENARESMISGLQRVAGIERPRNPATAADLTAMGIRVLVDDEAAA